MTTAALIIIILGGGGFGVWKYGDMKKNEGRMEAQVEVSSQLNNVSIEHQQETAEEVREMQKTQAEKQLKYRDTFKSKDGRERAKAAFDLMRAK